MVVRPRNLDEARAANRRHDAIGQRAGEHRAQPAAHHERGRSDAIEEAQRVGRLARTVGLGIEAVHPAPVARDDAHGCQMGEESRIGGRLSREQAEGRDGVLPRRMEAKRAVTPLVHLLEPILGNGGPRIHDDEGPDALGMPAGERHGVVAAHGMPDDDRLPPAQRVEDRQQVTGKVLGRVRGRPGPLTLAVAPLVEGHDVVAVSEGRRDGVEPVGVGGPTVQEEERGMVGASPLEIMKPQGSDSHDARPCGRASHL